MSNAGKYRWHGALLGVVILFLVLTPELTEHIYSGWIYPKFQRLLYWVFGRLPFPGFYVILGVAFLVVLKWLYILVSGSALWDKLVRITGHISKWLVWFFILWGFHYGRVPLDRHIGLEVQPLTRTELMSEIRTVAEESNELRMEMEADTVPVPETWFDYRASAYPKLRLILQNWDYTPVRVTGRELREDMLLRFDIGGFYLPYTGEANIDAGVHYYLKPFYMLHEMSHGNGFADEAACNFIAYAASVASPGNGFRYGAKLSYLRYLLSDLYALDSVQAMSMKLELPLVIRYDLELLKRHAARHTFRTSPLGEFINDRYLKLMGVPEGTRSYDQMVQLVYAWRKQKKDTAGYPDY